MQLLDLFSGDEPKGQTFKISVGTSDSTSDPSSSGITTEGTSETGQPSQETRSGEESDKEDEEEEEEEEEEEDNVKGLYRFPRFIHEQDISVPSRSFQNGTFTKF